MNKIIKWGLIALVGLIVLAIMTPEPKVVYKDRECSCADQEIKITKLKKVIELDNKAFLLTGDYVGKLEYWFYNPIEAEYAMDKYTSKINKIAEEKSEILSSL